MTDVDITGHFKIKVLLTQFLILNTKAFSIHHHADIL